MQIIFYLLIALTAFYTGSIDKRLKISRSGMIITPLAALTVVGSIIMCYVIFKTWLLVFLLLLAVLRHTGGPGAKTIVALAGVIIAATACIATGPAGWAVLTVMSMLLFLSLLPTAESMATDMYTILLKEMIRVLYAARKTGDRLRQLLPHGLRWLVALVEMPVVCSLAIAGVWQLMNWLYTPQQLSATEILFRLAALTPLSVLLYRAYLRDTVPAGDGRATTQQGTADTRATFSGVHAPARNRQTV
jgi:hypothetical protein